MSPKSPRITISMTPHEIAMLKAAAEYYNLTLSQLVRSLVFEALEIEQELIERGKYARQLQDTSQP